MADFNPGVVFSGLLGATLAIILKPAAERLWERYTEKKAVRREIEDLVRHLLANRDVISKLIAQFDDSCIQYPEKMHLIKLSIPNDFLLFSKETFRKIPSHMRNGMNIMRFRMRNYNITISRMEKFWDDGQKNTLQEMLTWQHQESGRLIDGVNEFLGMYYNSRIDVQGLDEKVKSRKRVIFMVDRVSTKAASRPEGA